VSIILSRVPPILPLPLEDIYKIMHCHHMPAVERVDRTVRCPLGSSSVRIQVQCIIIWSNYSSALALSPNVCGQALEHRRDKISQVHFTSRFRKGESVGRIQHIKGRQNNGTPPPKYTITLTLSSEAKPLYRHPHNHVDP
jgi:hypothetical protein